MRAVDLRSDTVTQPTAAMRDAMARAPLGDDVFGDDPSVNGLEAEVARLLGKEAAVFVPSGTMANQLALLVHTRRGDSIVAHARSHILNYEAAGPALLGGLMCRPVESPNGSLPVEAVARVAHLSDDPHGAPTRLVCAENTHNACGGRVSRSADWLPLADWASANAVGLHLDGARLANAAVASGETLADLAAPFDTVSLCFSKGLGAPVGSALAGPAALVREARRFRKLLGGGMRQAGLLAAAAQHALQHHRERLADDHRRARALATALGALPGVRIDPASVDTNIVFFELEPGHPGSRDVGGRTALVAALEARGVRLLGWGRVFRAVTHLDIDDDGLDRAIAALAAELRAA